MRTGQIAVLTILACLLTWGCATTGARQDVDTTPAPQQPDRPRADVAPTPAPAPEAEPEPEALPAQIGMRFLIPDGWQSQPNPENNSVMLTDGRTGSRLVITGWPAVEGGAPQDFIGEIWAGAADEAMSDTSLEVNMPMNMDHDGRAVSMFTMTRVTQAPQGELRATMVFLGFESNLPGFNVLIIGVWPEALDAQMMQTLEQVARSVIIGVSDQGTPPDME